MGSLAVLEIWLSLTTSRNVIAQPFTGKTVRQVLYKMAESASIEELYRILENRDKYKPYSTTPLLAGGRPLVKYKPGPPLTLFAGKKYLFRLTVINRPLSVADLLLSLPMQVDVYGTPARVSLSSARLYTEQTIRLALKHGEKVKLEFLTPTQLQLPKLNKRSKRTRYTQIPEPHLIFYGLRELWNSYAEQKILTAPWRANYALTPIFLDIETRTVRYDKDRTITGFTGTIVYRVQTKGKKVTAMLEKLLALASKTGIGKSRGIGLGYTIVKKPAKKEKTAKTPTKITA